MTKIYALLRDLNACGREGVVLKSPSDQRALKFVTPEFDLKDIAESLRIGLDLSSGFFFQPLPARQPVYQRVGTGRG